MTSGQARLRALDRCIFTGRLDSDVRFEDILDPKTLAESARDRYMLAVMS